MSIEKFKYHIGFSKIPLIGPGRFNKIKNSFINLAEAWQAHENEFKKIGLEDNVITEIIKYRNEINLDQEIEKLNKNNIKIVLAEDDNYPTLLKEIYNPPWIIYYRGDLPSNNDFLLAVVGTRKFSAYGQHITQTLIYELAEQGLTIVSGLALGIDSLAHNTTLNAKGKTIGVLGCGIEATNIYPISNRYLAEKIIANQGCILSEHPTGTPPLKHHFPRRNRIISGLSLGTLVIEAPAKSGALITAQFALEQNREVLAVPGNITSPNASGVNNLIKMGAQLITSASDVLEVFNLQKATEYLAASALVPEGDEEAKIITLLKNESLHVDELVRATGLSIQIISATLTLMEMKGKVINLGGMKYIIGR